MQRDGRFLGWIPSTSTNLIVVERALAGHTENEHIVSDVLVSLCCFAFSNAAGADAELISSWVHLSTFSPRYKSQKAAPKDGNIWEPDKSPEKENRQ